MIAAGYLLRWASGTVATRNSLSRHKIAIATCTGAKAALASLFQSKDEPEGAVFSPRIKRLFFEH